MAEGEATSRANKLSELTMKLKEGKSFVWKSFGYLHDKGGKRIHPDQMLCAHCFESGKMKGYKETVSTTNLAQHLREAHNILTPETKKPKHQQQLMTQVFATSPKPKTGVTVTDRKWIVTRQIALMCCEDLLPFEIVQKTGFRKFLMKNNVIKHEDELPDPTTVSRSGLNTVYDETVWAVKAIIKDSPHTVGITTDMWTDNYKRRNYMTVTLHFSSPDFTMHSMVLRTVVFTESHTGENIKRALETILKQFGLERKTVVYSTDMGANIVKACRLLGSERVGCAAHGLHNLIMVEGIRKGEDVQEIICKVKDIIKTFTYKYSLLEREAEDVANEQILADLENLQEEIERDQQISWSCPEGDLDDEGLNHPEPSSAATPVRRQLATTLKKDCPTRWNCVLAMLESLLANQVVVERCLTRLRLFEKMLSDGEWDTIRNLIRFLKIFKSSSEVLCGSKYPTISLVLLFRSEIVEALEILPTDCSMLKAMKERMGRALNHRLPMTELNVVAALLDPSQRNLSSLQEFAALHETTAVELISKALDKYVDPLEQQGTSAAEGGASGDTWENSPVPWKKAKQDLLMKHVSSAPTRDREIQQYRCLSVAPDDVLAWWKTQGETFPKLSMLARAILPLPATSAPSERIFSIAGLTVNVKRSSLAPSKVDKIVFVHENSQFVSE